MPRLTRRRAPLLAASAGALVAAALVALAVTVTAASPGRAEPVSYCSASRVVDSYHGRDHARLVALLRRVQTRAPAEVASVVAAMRAAPAHSGAYRSARTVWDHYNTNHCCTCIGGPGVPQLASTAPPNRAP